MERLTEKITDMETGNIRAYHLKRNFPVDVSKAVEKLGNYENLEKQGLLVKLLCKVGDTIYYPDNEHYFIVVPVRVDQIILGELGTIQYNGCFYDGNGDPETEFEFDEEDFGKNVFLTKEQAEQILKEREGCI